MTGPSGETPFGQAPDCLPVRSRDEAARPVPTDGQPEIDGKIGALLRAAAAETEPRVTAADIERGLAALRGIAAAERQQKES